VCKPNGHAPSNIRRLFHRVKSRRGSGKLVDSNSEREWTWEDSRVLCFKSVRHATLLLTINRVCKLLVRAVMVHLIVLELSNRW